MKRKILVSQRLASEWFPEIPDSYELVFPENTASFDENALLENISCCDALLSMFSLKVDRRIIDAGKNLTIISNFGVGYNNIDIEYAKKKGVVVTNTPDPVVEPTAELAFALMSDLSRGISECNRKLHRGTPVAWGVMDNLGVGLYGKQLGIIGMGRIGQAMARRAKCAGMKIVYHNRHRLNEEVENEFFARYVSLDELLSTSDYISLHTPLNAESYHMINRERLHGMKKGCFVVNTARGAVMDEAAVADALKSGALGGVGLDVYENEPEIHEGLLASEKAIIVPHIGTATMTARMAMTHYALQNILLYFEGKKPLSRIV